MTPRNAFLITASAAGIFLAAGCAHKPQPKPLTPEAFAPARSNSVQPADPPAPTENPTTVRPLPPLPPVANTGTPRPADPLPPPATGPATLPAIGKSTGQYLTLGGVVAEVNATPIHANKVLRLIDLPLREKAKQLDAAGFKRYTRDLITRTINELIGDELELAAALRNLDEDEKKMAEMQTMGWRIQQITNAGGSVELAKRRARLDPEGNETGFEFDELVDLKKRFFLINTFYQKRVIPRIRVSASDVREYYDDHYKTEFTQNEKVAFRLLKVDPIKAGSKERAITNVTDKLKRAKAGEDFADMCVKENDERMFATKDPIETAPSSFAIPKVRDALKTLQPGQFSDPIEDRGAFFIVRVESRQEGKTLPFDDQKVQDSIRNKLRASQYSALRNAERAKLARDAMIRMDENMVNIALDMAMQRYPQYAAAK